MVTAKRESSDFPTKRPKNVEFVSIPHHIHQSVHAIFHSSRKWESWCKRILNANDNRSKAFHDSTSPHDIIARQANREDAAVEVH